MRAESSLVVLVVDIVGCKLDRSIREREPAVIVRAGGSRRFSVPFYSVSCDTRAHVTPLDESFLSHAADEYRSFLHQSGCCVELLPLPKQSSADYESVLHQRMDSNKLLYMSLTIDQSKESRFLRPTE